MVEKEALDQNSSEDVKRLNKHLKTLNDSLKMRTFFVSNNMTIIDIFYACHLRNLFRYSLFYFKAYLDRKFIKKTSSSF